MAEPIRRRVLVTSSRTWSKWEVVWGALDHAAEGLPPGSTFTVVHGDCPEGGDRHARTWCAGRSRFWAEHGVTVIEERRPANWRLYGKPAGFRRNAEMVTDGADECLAFIRDGSRGATHCADFAERAGIPTHRYPWEDR